MARVALSEVVLEPQGRLLTHIDGASVTINVRGGSAATLYAAATGSTTVAQPLTTVYGRVGIPGSPDAEVWITAGSYDMAVLTTDGRSWTQRVEAVSGSAGSSIATVYATDYGVLGDGTTNNTTALNAAITAAVLKATVFAVGVARLILPPGVILTDGGHADGGGAVIFQGAGEYATYLQVRAAATTGVDVLTLSHNNSAVQDMTLDGNRYNIVSGDLLVMNAAYQSASRVGLYNAGADALKLGKAGAAEGCRASELRIRYAKGYGIKTVSASSSFDGQFARIDVGNSGKSGVRLDSGGHNLTDVHSWGNGIEDGFNAGDGAGFYLNSGNNSLENCQAETNNAEGIYNNGTNNNVTGGSSWGNYANGVNCNSTRLALTGVRIYRNGVFNTAGGSSSAAANVRNVSTFLTMEGCSLWDDATAIAAGSYGTTPTYPYPGRTAVFTIARHYNEPSSADNNTIVGNTMRQEDTRSGTSYTLNGTNTRFESNNIGVGTNSVPTVASASTVTIPADSRNGLCKVTGTTAITSLTACPPSTRVTLLFTNATPGQVTDGGNLGLAGNFVPTQNDTLTLVCDGTNWYEQSRSGDI